MLSSLWSANFIKLLPSSLLCLALFWCVYVSFIFRHLCTWYSYWYDYMFLVIFCSFSTHLKLMCVSFIYFSIFVHWFFLVLGHCHYLQCFFWLLRHLQPRRMPSSVLCIAPMFLSNLQVATTRRYSKTGKVFWWTCSSWMTLHVT